MASGGIWNRRDGRAILGAQSPLLETYRSLPLMPVETMEFLLLLIGWVVAFLLGRELQTGFRLWRLHTAEQRPPRED